MRAFRLAYDGAPYRGFQRQPDVRTVEDALFSALARLDLHDPDDPKPPGYSAAGRTDAGVSALAQTVAFEAPGWCSPSAFNAELPEAIRAWASTDAPPDFHAAHHARRRAYVYHLHAPEAGDHAAESDDPSRAPALHGPAINEDRLRRAADRLSGEHDFHNLTPDGNGTVRDVDIDVERDGDFIVVSVAGGGFPRQLVRRLVTLLDDVGAAARTLEDVDRALAAEPLPGHEGIPPAPAYPLVLASVEYDLDFDVDPDAAEATRASFEANRVEARTRSRVAGSILQGL